MKKAIYLSLLTVSINIPTIHAVMTPKRWAQCILSPRQYKCSNKEKRDAKVAVATALGLVASAGMVAIGAGTGYLYHKKRQLPEKTPESHEEIIDYLSIKYNLRPLSDNEQKLFELFMLLSDLQDMPLAGKQMYAPGITKKIQQDNLDGPYSPRFIKALTDIAYNRITNPIPTGEADSGYQIVKSWISGGQ